MWVFKIKRKTVNQTQTNCPFMFFSLCLYKLVQVKTTVESQLPEPKIYCLWVTKWAITEEKSFPALNIDVRGH